MLPKPPGKAGRRRVNCGDGHRELRRAGATSAFRGYAPGGAPPYPAVLCTSVNAVVVHGIPDRRQVLREGDVVGIDFACSKDGYCADAARTVAVGIISAPARRLIAATQECLQRAIQACVPGARLGDLGAAIQGHAEALGYSIVRDFVGHGIGKAMHEAPSVPNHGRPGSGGRPPHLDGGLSPTRKARNGCAPSGSESRFFALPSRSGVLARHETCNLCRPWPTRRGALTRSRRRSVAFATRWWAPRPDGSTRRRAFRVSPSTR